MPKKISICQRVESYLLKGIVLDGYVDPTTHLQRCEEYVAMSRMIGYQLLHKRILIGGIDLKQQFDSMNFDELNLNNRYCLWRIGLRPCQKIEGKGYDWQEINATSSADVLACFFQKHLTLIQGA